ncbi:hypothetical protein [Devosia sp.]|uniref:hypothetical protein n=1 Tax=Devosia sp. TaxID=1871048 RepID=UPI001B0BD856|nr:hypothetical protein [Devosia sp.]MBO9589078.1 hypothetical protein [Devosia sp.]
MTFRKELTLEVMILTQFSRAKEQGLVVRIYTAGSDEPFTFRGEDAELTQGTGAFEVVTPAITAVFAYSAVSAVSLIKPAKP